MCNILNKIKPGVITGNEALKLFKIAKKNHFAIPAINCINTDSINIVLETAKKAKSPVIIQFSYGGSNFISGPGLTTNILHKKAIIGALSGANHVHIMAKHYNVPVILHTDHCNKNMLPWIDELINVGTKHFKTYNKPLFTSHMIDLSNEKLDYNINICSKYLEKMRKINMLLEIELGCTGGEEDGINNTKINKSLLYTQPNEVNYAYERLSSVGPEFIIAASFGNVHGVYKSGNVRLTPDILKKSQNYVSKKHNLSCNPLCFVFHGGSGSSEKDIKKSIKYGVIKMNIDTDIQWATWQGILNFYNKNNKYLHNQIGNLDNENKPNKKYYDPRTWIRSSQISVSNHLTKIFRILNSCNTL
ncbi:fructose-bisphosphate aldolase class II [Buchnera aphidicola str. Bp (Baizongia pistaciae)]|uniref:Fructose-bisphosphate aldolase class 2 n=1 Tax=Buchnera aphidicola subsp. Baizongia pistaciae (strain Bp) TaxID=224915 RepID=ALF_BUCBP|nr:class II fructose-bisphosphate aldolase [Buchnera aphidicola]Q89AB6.1 RecName: Full=Fructose-bisphosphate aldolase class 2; Short=FBP aldolase; Short=FBPA; AltName: Full=Fructose-1,6-bisphosphate aldolase; AltName: Full=Fructose-bisphosphate aldolase class II [Buchnera aphidicola str. Bp (Baizongia pistaciae)]AAO27113.1 fructose-bisphosphate aldolase class II [Buchnera aphidicola str. Bp (Baizongia pistaciae)]